MISVCLATYNGEKYIAQQLQSILCQLNEGDEIIVSDDASTDKTIEIISNIKDKRITVLANSVQKGIILNIEKALLKAKGDTIFLSDQDDVWLPEKTETMLRSLQNYDLVVSDCFVTDENLAITHSSFYEINNSKSNKWQAFIRNSYLGCCLAFNRNVLSSAVPFPKNIPMHDIWIGNVASFNFKVAFIPDKLIYYRRHGQNASTTSQKSGYNLLQQIKHRATIALNLIKLK